MADHDDPIEKALEYGTWTSAVFAPSRDNKLPLVREPDWDYPLWKLPGGKSEIGENPYETSVREFEEETGLLVARNKLQLIAYEDRHWYTTPHMFLVFSPPLLTSFDSLRERGVEGEEIGIIEWDPILGEFVDITDSEFLETHMRVLQDFNIFSSHAAAA